jgi:predicted TIM-barrel fold metal-dependent hydrolase
MHTSHAVSPVPVLRLFLAGTFDQHPNVRLIIANPGALPYLMPRIDAMIADIPAADRPKRSFLDVWQHNFYLTTADVLDMSSMRALLEQIPIDRVLYASNYPLEERGEKLMTELRESGFLSRQEWEQLAWTNAEYLFGL